MSLKIKFIGATHEVTGSCTLLEVNGKYFLVDCGMEQGLDVFQNVSLPVPASSIQSVFVTHAHIDHSGMLPKLYKDGFRGSIYATDVTCNLCNIMLKDSAHIQEFEAQWKSRKSLRAGRGKVEPSYTLKDAEDTLKKFRPCNYGEIIRVDENVEIRFTDIGHLLGSACIEIWLTDKDITKKIVFSGDVGNTGQRIICDPKTVEQTDYLVIESTYGNRVHKTVKKDSVKELAKHIQHAFDRGGNVVIPSFAVGRTQEMLYAIREIKELGLVSGHGKFPVYVDSPLASEATSVFMQCNPVCFDAETLDLVKRGINPIWFEGIKITQTANDSKRINTNKTPKVIISASGMCEAGRIRHHLKHNLWDAKNLILFVGYQSQGSLGRKLLDGVKKVNLFGEEISVKAEIAMLDGTSGHADKNGLIRWIGGFKNKPSKVFVNHGEDSSCEDFKDLLCQMGYDAQAPYSGTEYDLLTGERTVYSDGVRITKTKGKSNSKANKVYDQLVEKTQQLLNLAKNKRDMTNRDNSQMAKDIQDLIDKWRD